MNTPRMNAYLALEAAMVQLLVDHDPLAEAVQDALDPIHQGLTTAERSRLNNRTKGVADPHADDAAAARAAELHALGKRFCLVLVPVERRDGQTLYTVECREEP